MRKLLRQNTENTTSNVDIQEWQKLLALAQENVVKKKLQ